MTSGNATSYYFLGGRLIAMKEGSANVTYMHQDHLTGTSVVSASNGALVSSISYSPFGDRLESQGNLGTDRLFTGQRLDGTGLYYYGGRYYDPSIGRFISPDTFVQRADGFDIVSSPLTVNLIPEGLGIVLALQKDYPAVSVEVPLNVQALNRYSYVLNNPLRYTDPNGWDTKGHGFNFNLGFLFGISIEVLKVTDDKGNSAWTVTVAAIFSTPTVSLAGQDQTTTADTVDDLARWSGGGGASGGLSYLSAGAEIIGYKKDEPGGWEGINVNIGVGSPFPEAHATVGWTWVLFPDYADLQPQVSLPLSGGLDSDYFGADWYYDPVTGEYILGY